jgi:hypothetical protein
LNAGSLTAASLLGGKSGLEYGLMATGLKPAPLGISPSQLRNTTWINSAINRLGSGSLFNKARSIPEILKSVEGQFKNSSILPGTSASGKIESYMDLFNVNASGGNGGPLGDPRTLLINSGLSSPRMSSDHLAAKQLLNEDIMGMLQTYYGENLYRQSVLNQNDVADRISRVLDNAISSSEVMGYDPNAYLLRQNAFTSYLREADPLGLSFNPLEMRDSAYGGNLFQTITSPKQAQKGLRGDLGGIFRDIQSRISVDPGRAESELRLLLGSDKDIATRSMFGQVQDIFETGSGLAVDDAYPGNLTNPRLSNIQKSARQWLLTSNLGDMPNLSEMIAKITREDFAMNPQGSDLQDYAGDLGAVTSPGSGDISAYKSSLYLKSKIKPDGMLLSNNEFFGTPNQLIVFDEIYRNLYESYRTARYMLNGVGPEAPQFPLWAPTWEQFNTSWVDLLDDLIDTAAAEGGGGGHMHPYANIMDNLALNPLEAEKGIVADVADRIRTLQRLNGGLNGPLNNLSISQFNSDLGTITFRDLSGERASDGWFYGLRHGRDIQGQNLGNVITNIEDIPYQIRQMNNRNFVSLDADSVAERAYSVGRSAGSYQPSLPIVPINQENTIKNVIAALKDKLSNAQIDPAPKKLSEIYADNYPTLDTYSADNFWSGHPQGWSYKDEANIQAMLDNAVPVGMKGWKTPMPDGFDDVVKMIFGPGETEDFSQTVWRDFVQTKDVMVRARPDYENFGMNTYVTSPFNNKTYSQKSHGATC